MSSIRVLTPNLELLAEIDDFEYLQFTQKYYSVGSFELRINKNKNHVNTLQKNNLIMIDNSTDKVGIIQYREIGFSDTGKQSEQWIFKGSTLNGVISQRVTVPPTQQAYDTIKGNAETVIKHYVNSQLVNPEIIDRKIDLVTIADNKNLGEIVSYQSRFKNLSEELEKIALLTNIGWKMSLDTVNKKWIFDCYEGQDRTTNQNILPPVIFSTDFETLKDATFIDSDINYKNFVYVGGQGEGVDRTILEIGTHTGLNRYEIFTDARDSDDTSILLNRGNEILVENNNVMSFEGNIINNGIYEFNRDWFLGDIVTVANLEWGVQLHTRIVEVTETFEPSGYKISTIFGNSRPTLTNKIKQELRQVSAEIHR